MAFEWNREVVLWDPVVENVLHVLIVGVDVEHEAGQTIPPLDVVHHGDLVPVVALEDRLGAPDVVHHVVAGSQVGLVERSSGGFVRRNVSCAHHHHRQRLRRTAAIVKV